MGLLEGIPVSPRNAKVRQKGPGANGCAFCLSGIIPAIPPPCRKDPLMPTDHAGPLTGVRVLDASRVLAGPFCGQLLGDLGADVIKVERPGSGDDTRAWGPPFAGPLSAYYLSCNRNKRAVAIDLAQPDGLELFHRLVERSDILLGNFR